MKKMLSYGLVGLSLLGITVGAVIPTTATEAKVEIADAVCDTSNTRDILSSLNSGDIKNLLEKYDCSIEDLENIASQCIGDTKAGCETGTDCKDNSLLQSLKDKLNQSKGNCETTSESKNEVADNKATVTENSDKNSTAENKVTVTESQDKNSVSDYAEKAKELLANKSEVKAEDVKKFCSWVNNSPNKKVICSVINSQELRDLLKKFGCSLDNNQNATTPPVVNTEPTDKTEPTTGNNSNSNSGNNSNNNNSNNNSNGNNGNNNSDNNSNNNSGNQNQNKPTTDNSVSGVSEYEKRVADLVNDIRVKNGLSKLSLNTELSAVARLKSQDMKDKKYFSHTSPTYGSPFDMMKQFGISYRTAGENIAYGYSTPEAVVDGWMNSPGHRANILNSSYKEIGVGYVASGHYWTQMFIG